MNIETTKKKNVFGNLACAAMSFSILINSSPTHTTCRARYDVCVYLKRRESCKSLFCKTGFTQIAMYHPSAAPVICVLWLVDKGKDKAKRFERYDPYLVFPYHNKGDMPRTA